MKPHSGRDNNSPRLESEIVKLLDDSAGNLPAAVASRLSESREISLDAAAKPRQGIFDVLDWRPAYATAALCLLAMLLLYIPDRAEPEYAELWSAEDQYLLGDDLSLYLWLSDTAALETGEEG